MANGFYEGFDAVIDKDMAAAVLAQDIQADELFILTDIERVAIHFGQPRQQYLDRITVSELHEFYNQGHFPPGSMGPKVMAAIKFVRSGGRRAVITSLEKAPLSLEGLSGTTVVPD